MTRARDVLYVAGIRGETTDRTELGWYTLVEQRARAGRMRRAIRRAASSPAPSCGRSRRSAAASARSDGDAAPPARRAGRCRHWLTARPRLPFAGAAAAAPLASAGRARLARDLGAMPEARSPASRRDRRCGAVARCTALLQLLPAFRRSGAAGGRAAHAVARLPPTIRRFAISAEAEAVLADPALADLFGPDSRAEVAIVGRVATAAGDYAVSGQIDRLVRGAGRLAHPRFQDRPRRPGDAGGGRPGLRPAARALSPPPDGDGAGRRGRGDAGLHRRAEHHANPGAADGRSVGGARHWRIAVP